MRRVVKFLKEAYEEIRKVVWPSREILFKHTIIVIVAVLLTMVIVGAIDFGLAELIKLLVTKAK